jgi:hypothetical protein
MKKVLSTTTIFSLLAILLTIGSCTKEDVIVLQNMEEYSYCVPASIYDGTTTQTFTLTQSQIQAAFAAVGATYNQDRIKNLNLKQISAQITTNAATFNQIAGFEVYAKGPNTQGNGTQIAYIGNIENNATQVTMLLNGAELKELLNETSIIITLRVTTKPGGNDEICMKLTDGILAYTVSAE